MKEREVMGRGWRAVALSQLAMACGDPAGVER